MGCWDQIWIGHMHPPKAILLAHFLGGIRAVGFTKDFFLSLSVKVKEN